MISRGRAHAASDEVLVRFPSLDRTVRCGSRVSCGVAEIALVYDLLLLDSRFNLLLLCRLFLSHIENVLVILRLYSSAKFRVDYSTS